MNFNRLALLITSTFVVLSLSFPSLGLDLDTARTQGLVKELKTGYIQAVQPAPSAEINSLVKTVNSKRKAAYHEIATKNKVSIETVAQQAAKKIASKLSK